MFYAETEQRERINAVEYSRMNQEDLKLFCPGCKEPIFFKNGKQKMAHFAHYAQADCRQFSEGETALHLLGKQRLYLWLKKQKLAVEMEAWLPELAQRPDLLVAANDGRKIALEYQCSPITFKNLIRRTEGYQEKGYDVIWLCGKDYRLGKSLSSKLSPFVRQGKEGGHSFLSYSSDTNQIFYDSQLHYQQKRLIYNRLSFPLESLNLEKVEVLYHGGTRNHAAATKHASPNPDRLQLLYRKDEVHRQFLERVYLARQSIQTLPEWLFSLPTKTLFYQEPNYVWKFDFLCWMQQKGKGNVLERKEVEEYFSRMKLLPTLLTEKGTLMEPLLEFIGELVKRGNLDSIGPEIWLTRKIF